MDKNYIVYYRQIPKKKKKSNKRTFRIKIMPDNLSWNKDSNTKKSEQQNLKHPYAYQHTHNGKGKKQK